MSNNDFADDGAEFDDWENAADDLEEQEQENLEQKRREEAAEKAKAEKRVHKQADKVEVKSLKTSTVKISSASRQVFDNAQVKFQSVSSMDTSAKITKIDPSELGTFMAEDVVKQLKAAANSKKVVDQYVESVLAPLLPLLRKQQLERLAALAGEIAATVTTSTADVLDTVDDAATGPSQFNAETDLM